MNNWRDDLNKSRSNFVKVVWPKIKYWFGEFTELIQVEEIQDSYAELLDKEAGIDYLIKDKTGIRPLSARVQSDNFLYKTVTIREKRANGTKTEFQKLLTRVNSNYLHPWLHIQAYVQAGCLFAAFGVKIEDLIHILDFENPEVWYRQTNKQDGNIFIVYKISGLKDYGIKVIEFKNNL